MVPSVCSPGLKKTRRDPASVRSDEMPHLHLVECRGGLGYINDQPSHTLKLSYLDRLKYQRLDLDHDPCRSGKRCCLNTELIRVGVRARNFGPFDRCVSHVLVGRRASALTFENGLCSRFETG